MRERLDVAREAILSAGSLLHETFGREIGGEVEEKDRNDFVTETDRQSEKLIVGTLLRAFPDIPVLAEESAERPSGSTWWKKTASMKSSLKKEHKQEFFKAPYEI